MSPEPGVGTAVWAATMSALKHQHPSVEDAVMRVAAGHWFDVALLRSLCSVPRRAGPIEETSTESAPSDLLFVLLQSLPFVEKYGDGRYRLHAQIRAELLTGLLGRDAGFVRVMNEAAAREFAHRSIAVHGLDPEEHLEFAYHLLAGADARAEDCVDQLFGRTDVTPALLDRLVSNISELRLAGRLAPQLENPSLWWEVRTAEAGGAYARVIDLIEGAPSDAGLLEGPAARQPRFDGELTFHLALAHWRRGNHRVASELARGLVDEIPDGRLASEAWALLGDLAGAGDEALSLYERALMALVGQPGTGAANCLVPDHWDVGWLVPEDPDGDLADSRSGGFETEPLPELVVATYTDGEQIAAVPADDLIGDIWLRIGQAEDGRGHLIDARAWMTLAERLYAELNDTPGFQRAKGAQQRLVARHGDVSSLRELLEFQQSMLAWASSTGARQLELQALLDLADVHLRLNELPAATSSYSKAADIAVSVGDMLSEGAAAQGLAQIAITMGDFEEADRQVRRAIEKLEVASPDDARRAGFVIGDRWSAAGDPARARAAYTQVLDWAMANDRPGDEVVARLALARLARDRLELADAEQQIAQAVALSRSVDAMRVVEVLIEQAGILRMEEKDGEAEEVEREVAARANDLSAEALLPRLVLEQAATSARRRDLMTAQVAYRHATDIFKEREDAEGLFNSLSGLAWVLAESGKTEEALMVAQRAESVAGATGRPDLEGLAVLSVASALISAGNCEEGAQRLLQAHKEHPNDANICTSLGWAYLRADRLEESLAWSHQALELQPDNMFPYRNIGHALLALGRLGEAKVAYAKAVAGRVGDENFRNTLDELELLRARHPTLEGLEEVMAYFRAEQERLDAREKRPSHV